MTITRFLRSKFGPCSGDWVEVRSAEEILATLDDRGCLDALPFMPEMLRYCGKKFRVYKSAHKACDTIETHNNRRMMNAVHLEGLRCDGEAHGGCQAGCLFFWKMAWLKPLHALESIEKSSVQSVRNQGVRCDVETLQKVTKVSSIEGKGGEDVYRCQATEMRRATTPLEWWDPTQYVRDLVSKNVRFREFVFYVTIAAFNVVMRLHWRLRPYPYIRGLAGEKTPTEHLNLQSG